MNIQILISLIFSLLFIGRLSADSLSLKAGLWGFPGIAYSKYKSDFQDKVKMDDFFDGQDSSMSFGSANNNWQDKNKFHILNHPIGLEYNKSLGNANLITGIEYRAFYYFDDTLKYRPFYEYEVLGGGPLYARINNKKLLMNNTDAYVGYQIQHENFKIAPKWYVRRFARQYDEARFYLTEEVGSYQSKALHNITWINFIGVNLIYNINDTSSLILEMAFDSPILGQISSSSNYKKSNYFSNTASDTRRLTFSVENPKQKIQGNKFMLAYSHKFNDSFELKGGYAQENLYISYPGYSEIPRYVSNNGFSIAIMEAITNQFIYSSVTNMTISSVFVSFHYHYEL